MAIVLSLTFIPLQSGATTASRPSALVDPKPAEAAEAKTLELRLYEINKMDKSKLNSADKKNLRKEVKSINHKLRELSGGVYLSAGLLVIILIALIVLL